MNFKTHAPARREGTTLQPNIHNNTAKLRPQASVVAPRPCTCNAQRAAPRKTACAPRSSTCVAPRHRLGTTIVHLRCTTSGAAGNGLGATMKYLRHTTSAAANNGLSTTITLPCSAASFEVNSVPHTGARPSVRLCVGPELARCVHLIMTECGSPGNGVPVYRIQM